MSTSRLTAALIVAAVSLGGAGALSGCGAVDDVKDKATTVINNATSDAQKELDKLEQQAKTDTTLSKSQKAKINRRIDEARQKLDEAKKKAQDALGD